MQYFRYDYVTGERKEIGYARALEILLSTFRDNDMTRDMLTIPNRIECRFSRVDVEEPTNYGRNMVAAPGSINLLPSDTQYDDNGKRMSA